MGFRFRRSVRLLPGVRLNFSTRGISTSVGRPGATLNFSRRGTRATVGLPGTGLSYSTNLSGAPGHAAGSGEAAPSSGMPASSAPLPVFRWLLFGLVLLFLAVYIVGRNESLREPAPAGLVPVSPRDKIGTVLGTHVNCRAAPSTSAPALRKFGRGDEVHILEQTPEWSKVVHTGTDCWVFNRLLNLP